MIPFVSSKPFSFNYPTFDQASGLNVAAKIYDVSTGSAVLVSTIAMAEISNGFYFGNYSGLALKTYLAVIAVYTDNTFTTLDTSRAPNAECYKESTAPQAFAAFNYGVFDQNSALNIAGNVFDVSTGAPILLSQVHMTHVFAGVYLGTFTGTASDLYEISKFVYTDSTFSTIDPGYATGSDTFQLISGGGGSSSSVVFIGSPYLKGVYTNGKIKTSPLRAVLKGEI